MKRRAKTKRPRGKKAPVQPETVWVRCLVTLCRVTGKTLGANYVYFPVMGDDTDVSPIVSTVQLLPSLVLR